MWAISSGELVVLPTDTVYGLAADAFSPNAVAALLAAKHRGRDMPVPVLIGSVSEEGNRMSSRPTEAEWTATLAKSYGDAKAAAIARNRRERLISMISLVREETAQAELDAWRERSREAHHAEAGRGADGRDAALGALRIGFAWVWNGSSFDPTTPSGQIDYGVSPRRA